MNKQQYINEVLNRSCLPSAERRRLKLDLQNEIDTALEKGEYIEDIITRMGDPDGVAADLFANAGAELKRPFYEYKSKATLFGLPLLHVVRADFNRTPYGGGSYPMRLPTARGIIAIGRRAKGVIAMGNLSAGIIAFGNLSAGVISAGNLSVGLLSLGNAAFAPLLSLGNIAAGVFSLGNIAVGYATAGNLAAGTYAVGNLTRGAFTFTITNLTAQFNELTAFTASLGASAPVRMFYGWMETVFGIIKEPMLSAPFIAAASLVLVLVIYGGYYLTNKARRR